MTSGILIHGTDLRNRVNVNVSRPGRDGGLGGEALLCVGKDSLTRCI